jgi:hypothetical protein
VPIFLRPEMSNPMFNSDSDSDSSYVRTFHHCLTCCSLSDAVGVRRTARIHWRAQQLPMKTAMWTPTTMVEKTALQRSQFLLCFVTLVVHSRYPRTCSDRNPKHRKTRARVRWTCLATLWLESKYPSKRKPRPSPSQNQRHKCKRQEQSLRKTGKIK